MNCLSKLNNKKILILGFQKEGRSTLSFCKKNISYKKLGIADIKEKKINDKSIATHFGENYLQAIKQYDVIIKSPGIALSNINLKKEQLITSQSDIFLSNCKAKIIGITGTKGKSTTSQLLYEIIKETNKRTFLVGNIGTPSLDYLGRENKNDWFVYELSSFQLQTINKSPHIAIILNVYPDHLDQHKSFKEYVLAKGKITKFQTSNDFLIYNKDDSIVKKISTTSKAKKIGFSGRKNKNSPIVNINPILKVTKILKINKSIVDDKIKKFKSLPYRIEYIGKHNGINFYNDSSATIPEATILAIKSISNLQTIIIGGSEKGANTKNLIDTIQKSKIKNVIILGEAPPSLKNAVCNINKSIYNVFSMKEAVEICHKYTEKNMACVLSPGFASFNMFKNYKKRGESFNKEVQKKINEK